MRAKFHDPLHELDLRDLHGLLHLLELRHLHVRRFRSPLLLVWGADRAARLPGQKAPPDALPRPPCAVVANLAATARKGLTLAVSFLFFPKPLTLTHAGGMLLFFVGLVWNSHLRHQEKERARAAKEAGTTPKKRD